MLEEIGREFAVDLKRKRRWRFQERASSDRQVEHVQVGLEKQSGIELIYQVGFHYDADILSRRPRIVHIKHRKTARVLAILSALRQEVEFECEALFEYPPPAAQKLFPVAVSELEQSERSFDEVRGITMVKLQQGEVLYTVTLQSLDLEELSLEASFSSTAPLSRNLPELVLRQAVNITSRFLE